MWREAAFFKYGYGSKPVKPWRLGGMNIDLYFGVAFGAPALFSRAPYPLKISKLKLLDGFELLALAFRLHGGITRNCSYIGVL